MPFKSKDRVFYPIGNDDSISTKSNILLNEENYGDEGDKREKDKKDLKDMLFQKNKEDEIQVTDLGLLPKWVEETCPTSWAIYNLFEKYVPFSGYIGMILSTVWMSMFLQEKKPISFILVGAGAGGKTYALEQFKRLPNLEDIEYPTYSTFVKKYGDTVIGSKKGRMLNNKFLYLTEMAMISRTSEQTRKNLFSCWNSIMTEGKYQGALKGTLYYIGERLNPIRFGLIGVMVSEDFYERVFPVTDFATRILIGFHVFLTDEVMVLDEGILYDKYGDYDISKRVYSLIPKYKERVTVEYDPYNLNMEGVKSTIVRISLSRKEAYGFRASADIKRFLKAHALLNKRTKVIDDDIKMLRAIDVAFNEKCSSSLAFQMLLRSQDTDNMFEVLKSLKDFRSFEIRRKHQLYKEETVSKVYQDLLMYGYFGFEKARIINKIVSEKKQEKGKKDKVLLDFFSDEGIKVVGK